MSRARRWATLAIAAGLLLAGTPLLPAALAADGPPAGTDPGFTQTTAEMAVGSDLVAAADGRSMVTVSYAGITQLSLAGEVLHTNDDEHLGDLAIGPDGTYYALTFDTGEVVAYAASDLHELARATLPGICGYDLEVAGGRVWVAGACTATARLGSFDLALAQPYAPAAAVASRWTDGVALRSASPSVGALWVRGYQAGNEVLDRLALDGDAVTLTASVTIPSTASGSWGWQGAYAVAPDGAAVVAAGSVYDGTTLAAVRRLEGADGASDWAITRDGHAVGVWLAKGEEIVESWSLGHAAPVAAWGRHASNQWWTPSRGEIVLVDGDTRAIALTNELLTDVRLGAERAWMSLDPPPAPAPGAPAGGPRTIAGRLTFTDGTIPTGQLVTVERVGPQGATVVGTVPAVVDGRFAAVAALAPATPSTYRARWAGDLGHPAGAIAVQIPPGATAPAGAPKAGEAGADRAVTMRPIRVDRLLTDDVHRRLFVLGNHRDNLTTKWMPQPRIDVYSYTGALETSLDLGSAPTDLSITPDGTHVLVALPDSGELAIIDAATLQRVGTIPTAPLQSAPSGAEAVGTDAWVQGGEATLRIPLARPFEMHRERLGGDPVFGGEPGIWADAVRPGHFYGLSSSSGSARWDGTVTPAVRETDTVTTPRFGYPTGQIVLPRQAGAPIRTVGWGLVDYDPDTFEYLRGRGSLGPGELTSGAPGPSPELVLTGWAKDANHVGGGVAVWGDGDAPIYTYDLDRSITQVGTTGDGALAFAIDPGYWQDHSEPEPTMILLHHPFARCRVTLSVPTGPLYGLGAVTITGRVLDQHGAGQAGAVQVQLGGGTRSVVADADGRFRADVTPTRLGPTVVRVASGADAASGCEASQALELLAPPTGPTPFASTSTFVARQVRDAIGVDSTPALTTALAEIVDDGAVTPDQLTAWLLAISDPISGSLARLYLTDFGRWPTAGELAARVSDLVAGQTMAQIATSLGTTADFRARFGTSPDSADAFVTSLYRRTLNRAATAAERRARLAELARGDSRGLLAFRLAQTSEVTAAVNPYLQVELAYLALLQRNSTWSEMSLALQAQASGSPYTDLLEDLRTSAAYGQRVAALGES